MGGAIIVNQDISDRRRADVERNKLLRELQRALAEVRTLSGLLPICANCKRIRDENDEWESIESYIRHRSSAEFTHTVCPRCYAALYPGHQP
jgi:hypothetical protein